MEIKDRKEINLELEAIDDMMASLLEKRIQLLNQRLDADKQENYVLNISNKKIDENTVKNYQNRLKNQMETLDSFIEKKLDDKTDAFLKEGVDYSTFTDMTFIISGQGKADTDENKINATIGSLFSDEGKIVAFDTVYQAYDKVSKEAKAAYAEGFLGNSAFREGIYKWINRKNNINLPHDVIATAGGTGAVNLSITNFLNENETLLIPKVCWGSYKLMAKNAGIKTAGYKLVDDNNNVDLTDLFLQSLKIIKEQGKLVVIINDPCQNPTGISYGSENWKLIIAFYKKLTEYGKVIIINDVAYIDYCYEDGFDYFKAYNDMNDDMLSIVCFSCSKSFTAYGQRVGAAIVLAKNAQTVERVSNVFSKCCRGYWSNINNGFMIAVSDITNNHLDDYNNEKKQYVDLLKKRADSFKEAAKACGLEIYPYTEGFFIFVKEEDAAIRTKAHKYLLEHHVYTLNFEGGLRVAICSLPLEDCPKLPSRIKEALEVARNG